MKYLIVGAGLFGATCARELKDKGHAVTVLEKRDHVGGMAATEVREGIICQRHGGHIFHTQDKRLWEYVNRFAEFRNYRHKVRARANGAVYSFPINLMTLQQVLGHTPTPDNGRVALEFERIPAAGDNLRDWAISQVGPRLYELFIEGYTRKQWGCDPAELPASIIKRIPVRLTWNDDYFDDEYQGVPKEGWTPLVAEMLRGISLKLGEDYNTRQAYWNERADRVIYTGPLDALWGYCLGRLEYRSLRFEHERVDVADYQGCATVNYTDAAVPWTRIHEHKHWFPAKAAHTVITREYPQAWDGSNEPYYPLDNARTRDLYDAYKRWTLARRPNVFVGGRMGSYRYFDMHQVIAQARALVERLN